MSSTRKMATGTAVADTQYVQIDNALWAALRMLEERSVLLKKMEAERRQKGFMRTATDHKRKIAELQIHMDVLKKLLSHLRQNKEKIYPVIV